MKLIKHFKAAYPIIRFSIPLSIGLLINMGTSFAALLMVSRLSQKLLAAAAIAVPTFITFLTITAMTFYAVGILIGHSKAKDNDPVKIGKIVKAGFWLALGIFIPSTMLLWRADAILSFFNQDSALVAYTVPYFHFAALSLLPTLCAAVLAQFFSGIGKPKFTLILSLLNLPLTLFFSYGYVFGRFSLPQLGLAGVSCAAFVAQTITFIGALLYTTTHKSYKNYAIFSGKVLPDFALCKRIFTLGFPIGIQFGGELAAIAGSSYLMGFYGVKALSASQIVAQYTTLILMVILGISQGAGILISEAYAKTNLDAIRAKIQSLLFIATILFIVILLIFSLFAEPLMRLFIHEKDFSHELLSLVKTFFFLSSIFLLADGFRNFLASGLRSLHDSKTPMRVGLISLWLISLPMSYLIGFVFNGGPIGLRLGFISGYVTAAFVLYFKIQKKLKHMDYQIQSNMSAAT